MTGESAPNRLESPWKRVRYAMRQSSGVVVSRPGRLYWAEIRAGSAAQSVTLFDHTSLPQNLLTRLDAPANGVSSPWPPVPYVSCPVERGIYVSFSATAFTGLVGIGWERT